MLWSIKGKAQAGPDACRSPSGALREKAICMVVNEPVFQNMEM